MSKYDKMLELNKRKSEEKVERAVLTIRTMVLEREKVSVPALMQKTGLSRLQYPPHCTARFYVLSHNRQVYLSDLPLPEALRKTIIVHPGEGHF